MFTNRVKRSLMGALWVWFILIPVAHAQDEQNDDTPARIENQQSGDPEPEDHLSWSVGAGFVASPRPYVDSRPRVFPIPVLTVRYKRFFFQGIRGGYDLVQTEKLTTSVFAQARFQGLEPEESEFLEGIETRKKSADAGVEVVFRGRPVGFRFGFLTDILGRSNGQEVSLLAITGVPLGKVLVLVGAGPRWSSQRRVDYYYGVREDEVRPERPPYQGVATWSWDLNVTTLVDLNSKWSFFALLNREALGSGIQDSPLIERSSAYSLVTSLTFRF